MHSPRVQLHHEQQVERHQSAFGPYFDGCKVDRRKHVPVRFEKRGPRRLSLTIRHGFDAVLLEDVANGPVSAM